MGSMGGGMSPVDLSKPRKDIVFSDGSSAHHSPTGWKPSEWNKPWLSKAQIYCDQQNEPGSAVQHSGWSKALRSGGGIKWPR